MNIVITGASGFIGSALVSSLTAAGHKVTPLVRYYPKAGEQALYWDPAGGKLESASLENRDAVIHLAGESITGRWTAAKKQRIRQSRVEGTNLLATTLAELLHKPKVMVCASAIGYYGDRGDDVLREESPPGQSFLANTCVEWEAAAKPAADAGVRVVNLRIGVVLHPKGGALKQMLLPFKLGAGGIIGSGKQWWSWIAADDLVGAFEHALANQDLRGPVNAVAPQPVTNAEFTKALGRALSRPTIFPMPAFAARLALGEMADELLLASARVEPARLVASGYPFRYPQLEPALRHLLGK